MLAWIDKYFNIKDGLQGKPELYLGVKLREVHLDDGTICWGMSSAKYMQEALKNTKMWMDKHSYKFPLKCDTPMSMSYRPELNVLEQLDDEKALWYMSAISIFHWAVELGRINICMEMLLLTVQMAMPRLGHLYAAIWVFGYLQRKPNA